MPDSLSARRRPLVDRGRRRVTAIDGLRVLAMMAIVVYHANPAWLPGGFLGVTMFFTISGYLITDGLLRELRRTGSVDLLRFYRRRLARLVPQMVLVIAATALLCAVFAPQLLSKMRGDTIPALLFVENWWYIIREQSYFAASGLPSPITHFWFLAVLMQFYLVWPLVLALLSRSGTSRSAQRRFVAVLALASAILAAILFDPRGDPSRVYYGTDTRLAEILVGAWAAYAFPTDGVTSFGKAVVRRTGFLGYPLLRDLVALVGIVALGFFTVRLNGYSPLLYRGGLLLVAIITAIVLAIVAHPDSLLARPLGCAPLVAISARTFGIYLWHYPLLLIMNPATRTSGIPWWGWLLEALALVAVVECSYHFIEQPFAQLIDDLGLSERERQGRPQRSPIPYMGALGIACGIAALLLVVGPFWYVDGAAQQAPTGDVAEGTATAAEPEASAEPVGTASTVSYVEAAPDPGTDTVPAASGGGVVHLVYARAVERLEAERKHQEEVAEAERRRAIGYEVDPTTGRTDAPVILIGDSVPAGAIDTFYEYFPEGYIDAEVGRQLYSALETYIAYRDEGYEQRVVVFASGDNGVAQEEDVRAMVEAAGPEREVYFVTVRVPLPLQDMNNELFYQVAEDYDNAHVIDWYAESEGHDEYFWDDGTHLRPEGAEAYVLMLRREIAGE